MENSEIRTKKDILTEIYKNANENVKESLKCIFNEEKLNNVLLMDKPIESLACVNSTYSFYVPSDYIYLWRLTPLSYKIKRIGELCR